MAKYLEISALYFSDWTEYDCEPAFASGHNPRCLFFYYPGEKHLDTIKLVERDSEKGKEKS